MEIYVISSQLVFKLLMLDVMVLIQKGIVSTDEVRAAASKWPMLHSDRVKMKSQSWTEVELCWL
jgi:hypothetical protein